MYGRNKYTILTYYKSKILFNLFYTFKTIYIQFYFCSDVLIYLFRTTMRTFIFSGRAISFKHETNKTCDGQHLYNVRSGAS